MNLVDKKMLSKPELIGKQVRKTSNKPFKSGNKINTVKGIMVNPQTQRPAFFFADDDSNVECWRCVGV